MFNLDKKNLVSYLTEYPEVTFNKEVFKKYTDVTNVYTSYKLESSDGYKYSCEIISNDSVKNSFLNEISLYVENDILLIEDITSVEITINSETTTSVLHKYSGLTLKAILLATKNTNEYKINLPLVRGILTDKFIKNKYKLKLAVNLNKYNVNLHLSANYIKMLNENELLELQSTSPRRIIRHIVDEHFLIEKGLNVFKLSPENMQCCLIFFTFPSNMKNINATLKIGENEHHINKYYSNFQFEGLNNNQNIMIFDIYKNVQEFYNTQPTGNILFDGNVELSFESENIGDLVIGYILLDMIIYDPAKIKFFDMETSIVDTNKPKNIKYITII